MQVKLRLLKSLRANRRKVAEILLDLRTVARTMFNRSDVAAGCCRRRVLVQPVTAYEERSPPCRVAPLLFALAFSVGTTSNPTNATAAAYGRPALPPV